jgi:hypothetical protein
MKKVTGVNVVTSNKPNGLEAKLLELGFTSLDIERLQKNEQYRKEYNKRPEVVAKRAAYMKARYERMKVLKGLLK